MNNVQISLREGENFIEHECDGRREGNWVIFHCPHCDFVRRLDLKSGKVRTTGGMQNVLHRGIYDPFQLLQANAN